MVTPDSSGGRAAGAFRLFDAVVSGLLVVTKFLARSTVLLVDGTGFALATGLGDAGFAAALGGTALVGFAGTDLLTFFAGTTFLAAGLGAGLGADFFAGAGLACFFTGLATAFALATGLRVGALIAALDTVFARTGTFAFLALAAAFGLLLAIPKPIL